MNISSRIIFVGLLISVSVGLKAQSLINKDLNETIRLAHQQNNHLIIAESFLQRPYKAFALSTENPEKLVVDFTGFDCVTFLENVISLYISQGKDELFLHSLRNLRYANADTISYESRNHYFTSAVKKLKQQQFLTEISTQESRAVKKNFSLLSQFLSGKGKKIDVETIRQTELQLSRDSLQYIPSQAVAKVKKQFQSGDLVVFVSKKNNLDCQHVGFLNLVRGEIHILHASQESKKVIVSDKSLVDYLKTHPNFLGIQVFRPNFNHEKI